MGVLQGVKNMEQKWLQGGGSTWVPKMAVLRMPVHYDFSFFPAASILWVYGGEVSVFVPQFFQINTFEHS